MGIVARDDGTARRIGILGGTFDPPHVGHLSVARHALDALGLDEVILMPNGVPAWKLDRSVSHASDRWAMSWLATRDDPRISVSRLEVDRPGITMTVDTVRQIREELPDGTEVCLIAGADSVAEMPTWEGIGEIARCIRIVAVTRPGMDLDEVRKSVAACPEPLDVTYLEMPPIPISSTLVRSMVRDGLDVTALVGRDVAGYIAEAGLYRSDGVPCGEREGVRPKIVVGRDCVGVGVGAVIVRDGRVLMLRRIRIPEAGMWDLPGGKVDLGETMEDAVTREVREETGLDATVKELIAVSDHIVPEDEMHFVVLGFLMDADGEPTNMEPNKHSEMAWIPLDDLPDDITMTSRKALAYL